MRITDLYEKYKNRSEKKIDAETKDLILSNLSSIKEINSAKDADCFVKILALCRAAQVAMDGEKRNNTLRTLLSTGEEGAYVENNSYINERFMYELIQNVDDCKYESVSDCKLKIDFDLERDQIILKYNELGFRPKDVIAISDIGNSTKNHHKSLDQKETGLDKDDLQEIGEKGIGFKSIFGLANKVTIQSGYFNFYFDYKDFTIPKTTEGINEKTNGTVLTVNLNKGIAKQLYKMLKENYKKNSTVITENPVLFLNKLTEIIYSSNDEYFGFRMTRKTNQPNIMGELMQIEYLSSNKEECRALDCYRYSKEVTYSIDECKSRFGDDEDSERKYHIEIITSANLSDIFEGRIYSFFPTEQKLSVPMIVQAPFKLDSARTNIANQSDTAESSNLWFIRTKNETIDFIDEVYEDLAKKIGFKIVNFIPEDNLICNNRCPLFDSRLTRDSLLNLNLFESVDGEFLPANQLYFLDKSIRKTDDVIEINALLQIRVPLLKNAINSKKASYYGFKKIECVDDKLFDVALRNPKNTERCLRYLKGYSIDNFKGDSQYTLNESQITQFVEYPNIVDFINSQTTEHLKNNRSILFELDFVSNDSQADLDKIREYCHDNDDHLNVKIIDYIDSISCVQDDFYENSIYLTNCIYTANIVEAMNTLLGRIENKYKNFFSFIRFDEIEKRISKLFKDDDLTDDKFLKDLTDIRISQKDILGNQYKNIITLINESGTKPQRFLMELLQNIDDANYSEEPFVEITYKNNTLTLIYNETGFTRENVASITAIGDSTKQYLANEDITGEKGIGFKSIFNVATDVEIHSNDFHFKLLDKEPTIPKRIKSQNYIDGTKMIVHVKNGYIDDYFDDEFLVKICLCLKQIKHLKINGKDMFIRELENKRIVKYKKEYAYYKFVYEYKVNSLFARKERYDHVEASENQKIMYLVPIKDQECYIYSTFPTSESMWVPVVVNANLKLNTSRDSILEDNEWNKITIEEIHKGFLWMLEQIKEIDYHKMMDIIPYSGILTDNFSDNCNFIQDIHNLPIFKVYNTDNRFISLNDGFIGTQLDKYIIDKWGYFPNKVFKHIRNDCIDFDVDKITDDEFYEERSYIDICKDLYALNSYDIIHPKYLKDDAFRDLLYEHLLSIGNDYINSRYFNKIGLSNWEIIPVVKNRMTQYIKWSENIYYNDNKNQIIPNTVHILDTAKMSVFEYRKIYGGVKPDIKEYSENVLLDDLVEEINEYVNLNVSSKQISQKILNLYNKDPQLFKECIKRRKEDLCYDSIILETRTHQYIECYNSFMPYKFNKGSILDNVIVSDSYIELAKVLSVPCISDIDSVDTVYEYFDYDSLNNVLDLECLRGNTKFFNHVYLSMFDYEYNECIEHEVYLKLIGKVDRETAKNDEGHFEEISTKINADCLCKYGNTLLFVYNNCPSHSLELDEDIKLSEFDHYDLLNDMRNDLQTRKMDDKIRLANSLIENCYYFDGLSNSIIPLRLSGNKNILLVDQSVTSEYDIVSKFKEFFLKNFSLALNVTRDPERYTRDYFEDISTIDYDEFDELSAVDKAKTINFDNISEIKDFMCKPIKIKNKVIGGYARTCPICGAKVQTELTGMRLYKYKNNNKLFEFISCPNCYENLRYCSDLKIDDDELENNHLTFRAFVNGEEWKVDHIKIRLGHKAILNVLNKKK